MSDLAIRLDRHLNNTSLALAIELEENGRILLFPADAQVGNWRSWHTVEWKERPGVTAESLLNRPVFYKVGHHASHNATLGEKGLELMTSDELRAVIPLDRKTAEKRDWHMPYDKLFERLVSKTGDRVYITDDDQKPTFAVRQTELYADFEFEPVEETAGEEINVNTTQQLAQILFEKIGLKPRRKTKTGYSTDVNVLEELAQEHPLPGLLLDYRELAKLKSTYTDALLELVHPETGRIHTSYSQTTAATGRLASTDPNMQNIPVRTEEGRRIRQAFVARPGCVLLAADYSQIELRIMAHLSSDTGLLKAFAEEADVHRATAAEVFGVAPEAVSGDQRRSAKAINFGLIYGMSAFGLAKQLGVSRGG